HPLIVGARGHRSAGRRHEIKPGSCFVCGMHAAAKQRRSIAVVAPHDMRRARVRRPKCAMKHLTRCWSGPSDEFHIETNVSRVSVESEKGQIGGGGTSDTGWSWTKLTRQMCGNQFVGCVNRDVVGEGDRPGIVVC